MAERIESVEGGRPICAECGDVVGGYPYGKPYRCGEHTSIIEYECDEECDLCGEPFLPGYGLQNMSKTYVLDRPSMPACDCTVKFCPDCGARPNRDGNLACNCQFRHL